MGQTVKARVTAVKADGKLDLSVRDKIPMQMDKDAEMIWKRLQELNGVLPFNDKAEPELIKREFGLSKNAFKRAVGRLLKEGKIIVKDIDVNGTQNLIEMLGNDTKIITIFLRVPKEELKRRVDLRDLETFTIDGVRAKDLDDAISLEFKDNKYFFYETK